MGESCSVAPIRFDLAAAGSYAADGPGRSGGAGRRTGI